MEDDPDADPERDEAELVNDRMVRMDPSGERVSDRSGAVTERFKVSL